MKKKENEQKMKDDKRKQSILGEEFPNAREMYLKKQKVLKNVIFYNNKYC